MLAVIMYLNDPITNGFKHIDHRSFWGIDFKTMELIEPPVSDKDNDGSNVNPKSTSPKENTESIHNILDAAGFIPGIGTPAGLIDAGIYTFIDGDYTSGFIAAATSIPGLKQVKGVAVIVKRTMPTLTKAEKIAKESEFLTSAGKFSEKELEEGYLIYVARKEKQGAPPRDRIDWKEARDYLLNDSPMARGNRFNDKAETKAWYPYNEVHLGNEKRLDSYNPEKGEIVSRKATDLEMIEMKTFESYLRELKNKYPPGTKIRSNKDDQIDGQELHGIQILEIPASNRNFERIDEYVALARDKYGITIRFREE